MSPQMQYEMPCAEQIIREKAPVCFLLNPCSGQQGWESNAERAISGISTDGWRQPGTLRKTRGSTAKAPSPIQPNTSPSQEVPSLLEWCQHLLGKARALHAGITESCNSPSGKGPTRITSSFWLHTGPFKIQTLCLTVVSKHSLNCPWTGQPVPRPPSSGAELFPNPQLTIHWHSSMPYVKKHFR